MNQIPALKVKEPSILSQNLYWLNLITQHMIKRQSRDSNYMPIRKPFIHVRDALCFINNADCVWLPFLDCDYWLNFKLLNLIYFFSLWLFCIFIWCINIQYGLRFSSYFVIFDHVFCAECAGENRGNENKLI